MGSNETPQKPRLACMDRGPGPAKYNLPGTCGYQSHDPTKHSKPAYSFGVKHKQFSTLTNKTCSPGPVYFVTPQITRRGKDGTPSYSLSGRPRSLTVPVTPSPNTYYPEKVVPMKTAQPPSFSFGARTKLAKLDSGPSPNVYTLPSMIGTNTVGKTSSAAFSMTGRSKIGSFHQDLKKTPGPGTYKIIESSITSLKTPSYTITGRNFPPSNQKDAPGPGTYSPEKVYFDKKISPAFSFGVKHSEYLASYYAD